MPSLRERFTVSWDEGEPVEIVTTVKDMVTALDMLPKGQNQNQISVQTALIYCALRREGHDIPGYDDWLLVLDSYERLPTAVVIEGPTQEAASLAEPSPLPASQVPTGEPGQTVMMTEPSLQQSSFS
jgi:hypothetical protein